MHKNHAGNHANAEIKQLKMEYTNIPIFNSPVWCAFLSACTRKMAWECMYTLQSNQYARSQNVCFSDWLVGDKAYVYCYNVITWYLLGYKCPPQNLS